MKPVTVLFLLAALVICAKAASIPDILILEEDDEDKRDKRALGFIANKIGNKFASKFGYHEGPPPPPPPPPPPQHELEYGPPITYHTKNFDIWGFKKAVFSALFQAIKAIKGGIIAFNGQLLKAKGHILATKGNILAAKGDAITNFGRELAAKSLLEPEIIYDAPEEHHHSSISTGYAASTTSFKEAPAPPLPTKSTAPEIRPEPTYEAPPSSSYGPIKEEPKAPEKDYGQSGLPGGIQAGLLVLKPINAASNSDLGGHFAEPPGSYNSPDLGDSFGGFGGNPQGFGSSAQGFGVSSPPYGGGSQQFGSGSQQFGSGSHQFGGGSQQFGGGSQQFGSAPKPLSGGSPSFGGGSQSYEKGPPPFGAYAGPLSPAAYDSFGGNSDLSASFTQSAVRSNQKKRAVHRVVPHVPPPPHPQGRPPIFYHNPNFPFRH